MFLTACAGTSNNLPRTVAGGECRIFGPPPYHVYSTTKKGQYWVDDTEEAGISACNWKRPHERVTTTKARKKLLKRTSAPKATPLPPPASEIKIIPVEPAPVEVVKPTKKPSLLKRIQQRLRRQPKG